MEQKRQYILITGASSGIGSSISVALSGSYNLILHGRDKEKLLTTKSKCNPANNYILFEADLFSLDTIENALSTFIIENQLEVIHFIHCAGHMKLIPLKTLSLETINKTFAVNVFSATMITKVLTQRKINSALQSVVFISSNISNFGAKAFSMYAASKAALDSIMRCLAVELAPKVRFNSVLPGAIHTEMTKEIFENKEVLERMSLDYPLGLGVQNDISGMVEFLISDKARWITGQQFVIDGGRTINISG
jgi:NAD(P)-dependent dehydrogenase (short-subunit alcohol dehydrogenase family)